MLHFLKNRKATCLPPPFSSNRKAAIKVINVIESIKVLDSLKYMNRSYINVCIKVQSHFVKHSCFLFSKYTGTFWDKYKYVFINYWNIITKLLFYGTICNSINFWILFIPFSRYFRNQEKHQESIFFQEKFILMSKVSM